MLSACGDDDDYVVKPRGYFRIDLPPRTYKTFDTASCPFTVEIPKYSLALPKRGANSCWYNVEFPYFKATLHLTYVPVIHNLDTLIRDSYDLARRHIEKSSGLDDQPVVRAKDKVYGMVYDISGNAATPYQFYVTDSTNHFLLGSFYFNSRPNKDSIAPVMNFLREDLIHFVETVKWK